MKYRRALLEDVKGYAPGEQPRDSDFIKLNTNENPYPPSPEVSDALRALGEDALRKYPDPLSAALRTACARRYGYEDERWAVAGNGMDELLAMALRTFVDPGDAVLTVYPTYTLYETLTRLHGARLVEVDLDEKFLPTEALYNTPARLCFFPRPNAPSGVACPRSALERLCETFDGLVIIDEAYVDFADDHCMDFPKRFENAVVMRTFSKSFSLASMRVGIAVARPEIIAEFLKTKDSYNMNLASQAAGLAAMSDYDHMLANTAKVRATRDRLWAELTALGFKAPRSQANFILAQWDGSPDTETLFQELRRRKILVRYFNARRLEKALRISVGTDEESDALVNALREIIGT